MGDRLLVAIPTRGTTSMDWALMLRAMHFPVDTEIRKFAGYNVDEQRNDAIYHALEKGFHWVLFLDDDTLCPPDTAQRLIRVETDIASGLYYRMAIPIEPLIGRWKKGKIIPVTKFTVGELVPCDVVGGGCLLVARRVFEKLPYPWFERRVGRRDLPPQERLSGDYVFSGSARKAGFTIMVDTNVRCAHLGLGVAELGGIFSPARDIRPGPGWSSGPIGNWIDPKGEDHASNP